MSHADAMDTVDTFDAPVQGNKRGRVDDAGLEEYKGNKRLAAAAEEKKGDAGDGLRADGERARTAYPFPAEEECAARKGKAGAGVPPMNFEDIMPRPGTTQFCISIDSPAFLRRGVSMAAPMLDTITLWLSNNTASYNEGKEEEARTGVPCNISRFAGIMLDCMDAPKTSMIVARMPLECKSVRLSSEDPTQPPPEEIGVTVSSKIFLETLQGVKEYQTMILYSEWGSNCLTISVVSTSHDSLITDIPLCATDATHQTVHNWDMKFDLSMPMADLKETVKRAANLESDSICFEIRKWRNQGFIFVMSANSAKGSVFRAFQVTYVTPLKRNPTAEVHHALEKLSEARSLLNGTDRASHSTVALEANVAEAEVTLKRHLAALYDATPTPPGFCKPARVCTEASTLAACEEEVRALHLAAREHARKGISPDDTLNAAEYLQNLEALCVVEVATSFVSDIRTAPFRKADVNALPCEYSAWFCVKKLQDMLKTPQSPSVQLHLPKKAAQPMSIRFDTGGGDYLSFVSFVLAPRLEEDN